MKIRHIFLLVLGGISLGACSQSKLVDQSRSAPEPWNITLLVTGSGSGASMKVKTPPMPGCKKQDTDDGCMNFERNKTGHITFDMSGNSDDFYITEFKICIGSNKPSPITRDCKLPDANALDFYVKDSNGALRPPNTESGKIEWKYSDEVETFVLHDRNLLKQEYYYLLVACDGPDPAVDNCLLADPVMDNKGFF